MKILLLTDCPPCLQLSGGLHLFQLCSFLPENTIGCYALIDISVNPKIDESFSWMPIHYAIKPNESKVRHFPGLFGELEAFVAETYSATIIKDKLLNSVVEFGKTIKPDILWCVLEGQTLIRLSTQVAKQLGIPLFTLVWDPPDWWLHNNRVDQWSAKKILTTYDTTIRNSTVCATASWAMAEEYQHAYGCETIPIMPSLRSSLARNPAQQVNDGDNLTIGVAGQLYCKNEWELLLSSLDAVNWRINGKKVKLQVLGPKIEIASKQAMHVEYFGWRDQEQAIDILSRVDILYCPYGFEPQFANTAKLSFPSKLTTYLAAGRPVVFHGPSYASPAKFLRDNDAAVICDDFDKNNLLRSFESLVLDPALYKQTTRNGTTVFHQHLTFKVMRQNFARFLKVDPNFLIDRDYHPITCD